MAIASNFPAIRPSLNLDFANARTLDPRITFSRASAATYYDGKTVAKAEENLLLNSAILATQSVTTRAEPYTLSFIGTGTVTLSGTSTAGPLVGTGAANRVSLTFTPTGGTLTLTVTGSVEQAQLEARSVATAYTPTTTQPITNYMPQLMSAAANVARFDHNPLTGESLGLLVEEQRTNLHTNSEDFSTNAWPKSGCAVIANQAIAPDGLLSADLVEFTGAGQINSLAVIAPVATGSYTFSFFVKPYAGLTATSQFLIRNGTTATNLLQSSINWMEMTVGANGTIKPLPNGWYRIYITVSSGIAAGDQIITYPISGGYSGLKFFLFGAQLEAGAFPTSYIKPEASQATRAADSASMTGEKFSSWYRRDEGTVVSEYFVQRLGIYTPWCMDDAVGSAMNRIQHVAAENVYGLLVAADGVTQCNISAGIPSLIGVTKHAAAYKANNFSATLRGNPAAIDSSGGVPGGVAALRIGSRLITEQLNGHIRRLAYYPKRLTDAQLQALTA
ncbi:phage head spike fiber domain-containing protein [Malikia spinosa]|uniref:phage head spike fiber domain-containing protein n=1 Tax=Malikia spinosa TaxID=86180 RepID=UPI0026C80F27